MNIILSIVICFVCVEFSCAFQETYLAGAVGASRSLQQPGDYPALIDEAGKLNVDILVLPALEDCSLGKSGCSQHYDETVQTVSASAKKNSLYVVTHLYEKIRCENKRELIRSTLVFDRDGQIVSMYRKPVNTLACNITTDSPTFRTDFGVTFHVLLDEDIVMKNFAKTGAKNFVASEGWAKGVGVLSAPQFAPSWTFTTGSNLISPYGIFAGKAGQVAEGDSVRVAELRKVGGQEAPSTPPVTTPASLTRVPADDLSQYIIRPIDLVSGAQGYKEVVCHENLCCEFDIKTRFTGFKADEVNYGLGTFSGARHVTGARHTGVQHCAVFVCAGLYKKKCLIGSEKNTTNIIFDHISIKGNFSNVNTEAYPIISSTSELPLHKNKFEFTVHNVGTKQVAIELDNAENILNFGILVRDYSKDFESDFVQDKDFLTVELEELYDDIQDIFDYLWIRVRILLVVVSIYVLEMM